MADEVIHFEAQVFKVQTLIDGGLQLTLDLITPTNEALLALINAKQPGVILAIGAIPIDEDAPKRKRKPDSK